MAAVIQINDTGTQEAIRDIMSALGRTEALRQQKQQIAQFSSAVQSGTPMIQAINQLAAARPQYSGGAAGLLQRLGSGAMPTPGIESELLGPVLSNELRNEPYENIYKLSKAAEALLFAGASEDSDSLQRISRAIEAELNKLGGGAGLDTKGEETEIPVPTGSEIGTEGETKPKVNMNKILNMAEQFTGDYGGLGAGLDELGQETSSVTKALNLLKTITGTKKTTTIPGGKINPKKKPASKKTEGLVKSFIGSESYPMPGYGGFSTAPPKAKPIPHYEPEPGPKQPQVLEDYVDVLTDPNELEELDTILKYGTKEEKNKALRILRRKYGSAD